MGRGVCVGVSVGAGVSEKRGVGDSVSVGMGVRVSVPCGDDMEEMFVDVDAGSGEDEAGVFPALLKLQAVVINIRMMRRMYFELFIA